MEVFGLGNEEQSVRSSSSESASICMARAAMLVESALDRMDDIAAERGGFMLSAQVASSQPRIVSTKRKFEEVDVGIGMPDFSGSVGVRPRRELREDGNSEAIVSMLSGRQIMGLGEQFNDFDVDSWTAEETVSGPKDRNLNIDLNVVVEEDCNFSNKNTFQVPCEGDDSISDRVLPGSEVVGMNIDRCSEQVEKTTAIDLLRFLSSVTSEDANESTIGEEQAELLMGWSSHGQSVDNTSGFPIGHSSASVTEMSVELEPRLSDMEESVMQMCVNEEHKMHFSAISEIGRGGSVFDDAPNSADSVKAVDEDCVASKSTLQFFVRTILDGRTVVLHANLNDTVESVHRQIQSRTGLPSYEQRLIYCGKQLQRDQTLAVYDVANDSMLHLVARMRSTALPHSWQLINDLVGTIRMLCVMGDTNKSLQDKVSCQVKDFLKMADTNKSLQDKVSCQVKDFLKMAAKPVPPSEHMQVFQLAKSVPPSEHMQVFQLAGATSALVMLMLSPVESNRECAEESIKLFTSSNEEFLPNHIHCYCAPILLEFCKLLAKSAPNHSLYTVCRSSLASLLDTIGTAHGSPYFNDAKASTIVQDFSPFVNELSIKLLSNLRWTTRVCSLKEAVNLLQLVKEGQDFTAFVVPLCKAMEACKGIEPHVPSDTDIEGRGMCAREDLHEKWTVMANSSGCLREEIGSCKWLHTVFGEMLFEIDSCLEAVEHDLLVPGTSAIADHPFGWAQFLVVLKGLHAIAKLYEGAIEELLSTLRVRRSPLNILIRQSRWHDDHFWLLEYGFLLDFESKKQLVMAMLPEPQDDHDERQDVVVHRSQLLAESFESLAYAEPEILQGGISVEFITEEATGPGVLREWFSLICREIFNPQNALFLSCPNDCRRFFPNPASGVNPGHLTYFRFCGRVIALALMHRVQIDVVLARALFMQLAGKPVTLEDIREVDPGLYSSWKEILDMDIDFMDADALALTFVTEIEELGAQKVVELCPGGRDLVVNSKNRQQYIKLLIDRRFVMSVAEQVNCFAQGFSDLLVNSTLQQFLRPLEPEDMDLMLYGKDRDICADDWKAHTEYHDYSEADECILWFWQVVEGMTMEQRRRLLFFSTSVTHLPAEGFSGLSSKFHIHRAHTDLSWLPTAHTCFYQLVLPPYPSLDVMCARLYAITEEHIAEGFGFA